MALKLVNVERDNWKDIPAALPECAAARYLGIGRVSFRALNLPYVVYDGMQRRLWLRADLDGYIRSRKRYKMNASGVSPTQQGSET
jgi:hypothetical protein